MTRTRLDDLDIEAPLADALEQSTELQPAPAGLDSPQGTDDVDAEDSVSRRPERAFEATAADVAEQLREVPLDDDEGR